MDDYTVFNVLAALREFQDNADATRVGSPEENCKWVVQAILKKSDHPVMRCTVCHQHFSSDFEISRLGITVPGNIDNTCNPSALDVRLGCPCGHVGTYTMRPNPLIG